ncbi:MAG: hypothetical protein J5644_10560 [Bacteroidales bacterium]|nr:hypothetical protein [Bacteroidales bacterium]
MEKNTGKTECLNYLLRGGHRLGHCMGVTSIGLDGEMLDQVTATSKPEIFLAEGTLFATSEKLYRNRRLTSEILDLSAWQSALGRLVTARTVAPGKVMLSGPVSTGLLRETIALLRSLGAQTVLVDGALSRKSLGSPAVTRATILATGAAFSPNIPELVRKTRFVYQLMQLPVFQTPHTEAMLGINQGIWAVEESGELHDLGISSALLLDKEKGKLFRYGHRIFVSGIVSDKLLDTLRMQREIASTELVVKDFTRFFVTPASLHAYQQKGGKLSVLLRPNLLAVCVNPWSPSGFLLDSDRLRQAMSEVIHVPVYDVRRESMP